MLKRIHIGHMKNKKKLGKGDHFSAQYEDSDKRFRLKLFSLHGLSESQPQGTSERTQAT